MPKDWDIPALEHKARVTQSLISFFARQIDEHGEAKACAIVKALSKRHLHLVESKSVEWEGLTLSRQPSEIEQICVKDISDSQDDGKAKITKILLDARAKLNKEAIAALEDMKPADYHALVLTPPKSARKLLRTQLEEVYARGRELVSAELAKQGKAAPVSKLTMQYVDGLNVGPLNFTPSPVHVRAGPITLGDNGHSTKQDEDIDEDLLDSLTDLTLSRLTNAQQSRLIEIIAGLVTLGVVGSELMDRLREGMRELSDAPTEAIASGITNRVLAEGRRDEGEARKDDWELITYSSILDRNTCLSCENEDGKESKDGADLEPVPNIECEGGSLCRCFWIYSFGGEQ